MTRLLFKCYASFLQCSPRFLTCATLRPSLLLESLANIESCSRFLLGSCIFHFFYTRATLSHTMSGLSLAVGPRHGQKSKDFDKDDDGSAKGLMGSIRTIELQLVAFIVVFSASGLVPVADLLFPVFVTPYLYILSKFVFPTLGKEGHQMEVFHGSRMFQLYVVLGTVLGLFLPLAYVLGGFARGDQHAVRASTPHLFLLSVQILSENLVSNLAVWSPPVRAFLVAIYNTRRIFSLADWVYDAFYYAPPPEFPKFRDLAWMGFGRGLAAANLVYFIINIFCFILPRFIPRAFERYLEAKAAHEASVKKGADDKLSSNPPAEASAKKAADSKISLNPLHAVLGKKEK